MAGKWIIALGREYCSGGAEIGRKVAEALGIPYYDREIIDRSAHLINVSQDVVENNEEKPASFWSTGDYQYEAPWYISDPALLLPIGIKVAEAQFEVIRSCAASGPCVIVGRCADYILRDNPRLISVFIYADKNARIARAEERHQLSRADAVKLIDKADKIRSKYYKSHTDRDWGSKKNFDLMIDSGKLGIDLAAQLIINCAENFSRSTAPVI